MNINKKILILLIVVIIIVLAAVILAYFFVGKVHAQNNIIWGVDFSKAQAEYLGLDWKLYVKRDAKYYRPTEVDLLQGDSSKARRVLGWEPKVGFKQLIEEMVDADWREAQNGPNK